MLTNTDIYLFIHSFFKPHLVFTLCPTLEGQGPYLKKLQTLGGREPYNLDYDLWLTMNLLMCTLCRSEGQLSFTLRSSNAEVRRPVALRQDIAEAIPALSPTTVWLQDKGFFFFNSNFSSEYEKASKNCPKPLAQGLGRWHGG